jgi:hypothetical protein
MHSSRLFSAIGETQKKGLEIKAFIAETTKVVVESERAGYPRKHLYLVRNSPSTSRLEIAGYGQALDSQGLLSWLRAVSISRAKASRNLPGVIIYSH